MPLFCLDNCECFVTTKFNVIDHFLISREPFRHYFLRMSHLCSKPICQSCGERAFRLSRVGLERNGRTRRLARQTKPYRAALGWLWSSRSEAHGGVLLSCRSFGMSDQASVLMQANEDMFHGVSSGGSLPVEPSHPSTVDSHRTSLVNRRPGHPGLRHTGSRTTSTSLTY